MLVDAPDLLTANANKWLQTDPKDRMVRTIDNTARAFLSNKYKPMDNLEFLAGALPVLDTRDDLKIVSAQLTDERMYIQVMFESINKNVGLVPYSQGATNMKVTDPSLVGKDVINYGLTLSNSEVGMGGFNIEDIIWRALCANCLIFSKVLSKIHLGRSLNAGELGYDVFTEETHRLTDQALQAQVKDALTDTVKEDHFLKLVEKIEDKKAEPIEADKVNKTIKEVTKKYGVTEGESEKVLANLIQGGMLNRWGIVNAVTATAKDADYDRGIELERIGGKILAE
jgi:hypothetical protein